MFRNEDVSALGNAKTAPSMRAGWVPALALASLFAVFAAALCAAEEDGGRIRPWDENPRYWQYMGEPVLLLGGSDEDNLFNDPEMMLDNFAKMRACGANYIRGTLSIRDENNVPPYLKKDGLYDLDAWNPEYWKRLEDCVRLANEQGAIVQIEFWATFDHYRDQWKSHPFNPELNEDVTGDNSELVPEWNHHPASKRQPFFFSVPPLNNDTVLLTYQERFVRKVLDVTLPHPNVLYCLDNETRAPAEWAHYWGNFIQTESRRRGVPVQLTEMWDNWDIRTEEHTRTYEHPEYFTYVDVSQNNWQEGQTHYDRLMWYRDMLAGQPGGIRPMNNVKVYHRLGGGRPNAPAVGIDRWWQNIFAGCASTRFHRPDSGLGLNERAQTMIRSARDFTSSFDIFRSEPAINAMEEREENEAYCLAVGGDTYALYFPGKAEIALRAEHPADEYNVTWFIVEQSAFLSPARPAEGDGQGRIVLKTPDSPDSLWLALVTRNP